MNRQMTVCEHESDATGWEDALRDYCIHTRQYVVLGDIKRIDTLSADLELGLQDCVPRETTVIHAYLM